MERGTCEHTRKSHGAGRISQERPWHHDPLLVGPCPLQISECHQAVRSQTRERAASTGSVAFNGTRLPNVR
jgi:hypothetical protein